MTVPTGPLTIRPAYPDDALALARLAALDSRPLPAGGLLVAERDGELLAALSLADGQAVADPFVPTARLVEALRVHAQRPERPPRRHRALARLVLRPVGRTVGA